MRKAHNIVGEKLAESAANKARSRQYLPVQLWRVKTRHGFSQ